MQFTEIISLLNLYALKTRSLRLLLGQLMERSKKGPGRSCSPTLTATTNKGDSLGSGVAIESTGAADACSWVLQNDQPPNLSLRVEAGMCLDRQCDHRNYEIRRGLKWLTMKRRPRLGRAMSLGVRPFILQELIAQLIQSGALPVERAQRVFDIALQRTIKATEQAPGATRFVKHVHDKLQLNDYYRSTLPHPAAWDQGRK
jgi:hypothetical protein